MKNGPWPCLWKVICGPGFFITGTGMPLPDSSNPSGPLEQGKQKLTHGVPEQHAAPSLSRERGLPEDFQVQALP